MCAPWVRVSAVEQLRTRHGLSVIDKNKTINVGYPYVAAPECLACATTKQKNIKIKVIWNLWPHARFLLGLHVLTGTSQHRHLVI